MPEFVGLPSGMSLANAAILESLLNHLLMVQILKPGEVVSILDAARHELSKKNSTIVSVQEATSIVSQLLFTFRTIEADIAKLPELMKPKAT
jgi:hypothetical protein